MKKKIIPHISEHIDNTGVFVIAEIGKNFIQTEEPQSTEVYLKNAKELIDAAVDAGAHAVKFQTHEVEDEQMNVEIVSPHFKGSDRYSWVKRNMEATPISFWKELKAYAEEKKIIFFSTPMSRNAAIKLESLDIPLWKVGSGDVQDYVLLNYITESKKPIIISSGMVSHEELDVIVNYIEDRGSPIVVLYCVSKYPCPPEAFNLSTLEHFIEKYPKAIIGFSDHSVGDNTVPLAAVKMGAQVIEKHFSFSRDLWGSDHKASITPQELKELVESIKRGEYRDIDVTSFYGEKNKELDGADNQFRPYFNKSLVAACDIPKGTIITKEMVYAMRPKMYIDGAPSHELHIVEGKKIKRDLKKFDPIKIEILE